MTASKANGIEGRVVRILEGDLSLDVASPDADLFNTCGMDSMLFIQLLAALEMEFGIEVKIESIKLEQFRSVSSITRFLDQAVGSAG